MGHYTSLSQGHRWVLLAGMSNRTTSRWATEVPGSSTLYYFSYTLTDRSTHRLT